MRLPSLLCRGFLNQVSKPACLTKSRRCRPRSRRYGRFGNLRNAVHPKVVGSSVTPTFLSASFEAFLPRAPRGQETSQLAGSKARITDHYRQLVDAPGAASSPKTSIAFGEQKCTVLDAFGAFSRPIVHADRGWVLRVSVETDGWLRSKFWSVSFAETRSVRR
jgi:hypothetical protein